MNLQMESLTEGVKHTNEINKKVNWRVSTLMSANISNVFPFFPKVSCELIKGYDKFYKSEHITTVLKHTYVVDMKFQAQWRGYIHNLWHIDGELHKSY